jgi:two-component system nitrogen regulation sensor histidine kinase NtrY
VKSLSTAISRNADSTLNRLSRGKNVKLEEITETLEIAKKSSDEVSQIVDEFQWLARSRDELIEETDLLTIVEEAVKETHRRVEIDVQDWVAIKTDGTSKFCLMSRANLLRRAITNLLLNAVEAIRSTGKKRLEAGDVRIELRLEEDQKQLVLSIHDRGPGLPKEIDIFEPYFSTKGGRAMGILRQRMAKTAEQYSLYTCRHQANFH